MRIAVASNGLDVAENFPQCLNFNYYTTKSYEIAESQNIPAQGLTGEEYADLMERIAVDTFICHSITPAHKSAFEDRGIEVVSGASGRAMQVAESYVQKKAEELENEEAQEDDE